jgi:hypothetical protein
VEVLFDADGLGVEEEEGARGEAEAEGLGVEQVAGGERGGGGVVSGTGKSGAAWKETYPIMNELKMPEKLVRNEEKARERTVWV